MVVAVFRTLDRRWRVEVDGRGVCRIIHDRALVHTALSVEKAAEWLREHDVDQLVRD